MRELLQTKEFAAQPLHPCLEAAITRLEQATSILSRDHLIRDLFLALRPLWLRSVAFGLLGRVGLLVTIALTTSLLQGQGEWAAALGFGGGFWLAQVVTAIARHGSDLVKVQIAQGVELELTAAINAKLRSLSDSGMRKTTSGTVKTLLASDLPQVGEFFSSVSIVIVPALVSIAVLGPAAVHYAGAAGAVAFVAAFGSLVVGLALGNFMRRFHRRGQAENDKLATLVGEWLRNVRLARYLGWQGVFERDIAARLRTYMRHFIRRHLMACLIYGLSHSWWLVPILLMLIFVKAQGEMATATMAGIFAALWIVKDLSDQIQMLPHTISMGAVTRSALKRVRTLLEQDEWQLQESDGSGNYDAAVRSVPLALIFEGVELSYDKAPVLQVPHLRLALNARTAIVGRVGAGKTTLLKLVVGELAPSAGTIQVEYADGARRLLWNSQAYRDLLQRLAVVHQEPFISEATLAQNISLDETHPADRHLDASNLSELAPDLATFAQGLGEKVGETGVNLSGGQKQRVTIARALYARRPILVLDDPLAAVDPRTEGRLLQALTASSDGFLLVSHRLNELQNLDRVLVLESGLIVEDGVPRELLADPSSRFAKLRWSTLDDEDSQS